MKMCSIKTELVALHAEACAFAKENLKKYDDQTLIEIMKIIELRMINDNLADLEETIRLKD